MNSYQSSSRLWQSRSPSVRSEILSLTSVELSCTLGTTGGFGRSSLPVRPHSHSSFQLFSIFHFRANITYCTKRLQLCFHWWFVDISSGGIGWYNASTSSTTNTTFLWSWDWPWWFTNGSIRRSMSIRSSIPFRILGWNDIVESFPTIRFYIWFFFCCGLVRGDSNSSKTSDQ